LIVGDNGVGSKARREGWIVEHCDDNSTVGEELRSLFESTLDDLIDLTLADFGNVQLYDPALGGLRIAAQRGFGLEFLDYFAWVDDGGSACGRASLVRTGVAIADVEIDPAFEPHRPIAARTGFRAVQSTPFFAHAGELLGVISTHFHRPRRLSERDWRVTDVHARHAAELVELTAQRRAVLRCEDCGRRSAHDPDDWVAVRLATREAASPPALLTYCGLCARQFEEDDVVWRPAHRPDRRVLTR
jgi:hypothetical protein